MPAQRLDDQPVAVHKFDVAGQDSDHGREFIRHVGLAAESFDSVSLNVKIPLVEMAPPLNRGTGNAAIQTVGTAMLSADEINQIGVFIDELSNEYKAHNLRGPRQYIVRPHMCDVLSEDRTVISRRFSCAGFIIEAYRDAGVDLISSDEAALPSVSLETLILAYSDLEARLRNPHRRASLGLDGDGPWAVLLPGHVLNALNRKEEDVRSKPYAPVPGDQYFPASATHQPDFTS